MNTDQNTTNSQSIQDLTKKMEDLLAEEKKIVSEIEEINKDTREKMDNIEGEIHEEMNNIDELFDDLDKADKKAEEDLDKLILTQAEELADDEDEEV